MAETYDWAGFYGALCEHGPNLLVGIGGDDGVREVIAMMAVDSDDFWSDGLQPVLAEHAGDDELRAGVLATLELWRENVLTTLSANFGIELDWGTVGIDANSPLIGDLVKAAAPE